jgi:hypothetical protein
MMDVIEWTPWIDKSTRADLERFYIDLRTEYEALRTRQSLDTSLDE